MAGSPPGSPSLEQGSPLLSQHRFGGGFGAASRLGGGPVLVATDVTFFEVLGWIGLTTQ
jgi:hypothetical protein